MENNKFQKLIISILILLIIATFSYFYLLPYLNDKDTKISQGNSNDALKKTDLVKETSEKNPNFQEAANLSKQGYFENAISKYNEALQTANSIEEKSIIDISRAYAYMGLKKYDLATGELKRIGDNVDYPISVRVAAFDRILSEYRGTRNTSLLNVFKTSTDSKENLYDLQLSAYRQTYNLSPAYPSGFAVSFLAIDAIKNAATTTDISLIYTQAISKIEDDIARRSNITAGYNVPNLILSKIRVMKAVGNKEIVQPNLIYQEYERALNESRSRLQNVTEYFTIFEYLNYLAMVDSKDKVDTDKASRVFNLIINSPKIPDMVVTSLKYENYKSNWPGLYLYSKKNLDTINYFKTYGWE